MPLRFNEEDAVVLSEEAVQFGFGWNESYRTYQETLQDPAYGPRTQKFGKPAKQAHGRKRANYDKIEEDGLPAVGAALSEYDVVIGKQVLEYPLTKT
jgi:DNA-directed RNA polymerase beta subunit